MNKHLLDSGGAAEILLVAAAFFLGLRTDKLMPLLLSRLGDALLVLAGIFAILSREFRTFVHANFAKFAPYLKYLSAIAALIVAGQYLSFLRFGAEPFGHEILADYSRTIMNYWTFFLAALVVCKNPRLLRPISAAIIASFALVIPVYFIQNGQVVYFSGSRLSGLLKSPIVFGAWASMAFILCIGFIMEVPLSHRDAPWRANAWPWKKIALVAWLALIASFLVWSGTRAAWWSLAIAMVLFAVVFLKQRTWGRLGLFLSVIAATFSVGYLLIGNNYADNMPRPQIQSYMGSRAKQLVTTPAPYRARTDLWRQGIIGIYNFPFGFGFTDETLKSNYPASTNTFLEVAVYGGIFALAAFLAIILKLAAAGRSAKTMLADKSRYLKLSWLIAGAALLVNIFSLDFFLVRIFWFALGIIAGLLPE